MTGTTGTRRRAVSREQREALRRKRKRRVIRNRIIFGSVCALALALIIVIIVKLFGLIFGSSKAAETSTLTFKDNGSVVFEEVLDFDTDTYSKSELKEYTKDLIDSFNETYGGKAITLDKLEVKGDVAYIKTTYKSTEAYEAFTSYETFASTYDGACEAGYDFGEQFRAVTEGTLGEAQVVDAASTFSDSHVVIVSENVTVVVPGTITYVSNADVEITDVGTAVISQKDGNDDATDLVYIIY